METSILIVEDDEFFTRFLQRVCENELPFLKVDVAENGWEAVKLIVKNPKGYSLVVIDVDMAPISGDDLATILNIFNKYKLTDLKALTISGKVSERPGDYLAKPFTPEEFGAKVSEILDRDAE